MRRLYINQGTVSLAMGFLALATMGLRAESSFTRTWEGTTNDLPSVELTVQNDDGRIGGVIGFYFQTRSHDGKWRVGEKTTLPLLSPKLDGSVLTFETTHRKKHDSPELGPNNKYRVVFIDANEARLNIVKEDQRQNTYPHSGLKLTLRI